MWPEDNCAQEKARTSARALGCEKTALPVSLASCNAGNVSRASTSDHAESALSANSSVCRLWNGTVLPDDCTADDSRSASSHNWDWSKFHIVEFIYINDSLVKASPVQRQSTGRHNPGSQRRGLQALPVSRAAAKIVSCLVSLTDFRNMLLIGLCQRRGRHCVIAECKGCRLGS